MQGFPTLLFNPYIIPEDWQTGGTGENVCVCVCVCVCVLGGEGAVKQREIHVNKDRKLRSGSQENNLKQISAIKFKWENLKINHF